VSHDADSVAFLHSTYEEALALTREARDYLAEHEPADRTLLSPETQLVACCESMRLTSRLTQVMAWLLVQRAVEAGEIERAEAARPGNRLGGQKVCAATGPVGDGVLPAGLTTLLDKSLALYNRVARLDAMLGSRGAH
jgi:regulator of CtrA degradation